MILNYWVFWIIGLNNQGSTVYVFSDSQAPVTWSTYEGKEYEDGFRLKLPHTIVSFPIYSYIWTDKYLLFVKKFFGMSYMISWLSRILMKKYKKKIIHFL